MSGTKSWRHWNMLRNKWRSVFPPRNLYFFLTKLVYGTFTRETSSSSTCSCCLPSSSSCHLLSSYVGGTPYSISVPPFWGSIYLPKTQTVASDRSSFLSSHLLVTQISFVSLSLGHFFSSRLIHLDQNLCIKPCISLHALPSLVSKLCY